MDKIDYKKLLNKFNTLHESNEKKKALGIHDYSLINALLNKNREVELHSNFIYSMINPNSTHYCGTIFLKFFLESINETGFINLDNARVHKEKGKIDLLIEDGKKVIIIENKLRAVDQKYQISRYIQYSIENYLDNDKECLEDKIHIVYLSEYKAIPTKNKESTIGFQPLNKDSKQLIWDKQSENTILKLPNDTKLKFNRVKHSKHLLKWIDLSKDWLQKYKPHSISRSLDYAFDEYGLILKRLDTKKRWRNLMSLDEYTLGLSETEQEDMYAFMCEANVKLNNFLASKLFQEINTLFPIEDRQNFKEFKEFNRNSCKKWFQKNGDYKDVGFIVEKNKRKYIFAFGLNNIVYGEYKNYDFVWKSNIKSNRKNLQTNSKKNLFDVINDLKEFRDNAL